LNKDRSRQWIIETLQQLREKFEVDLWAYVIMPEHLHLLLWPRKLEYRMEHLLAAIKRPVSAKAKQFLETQSDRTWLKKLTVVKGCKDVFRFWQPGGGFDRNIWQEHSLHDVIRYIHENPVRRGLVGEAKEWEWSSARFWEGDDSVRLKMDPLEF